MRKCRACRVVERVVHGGHDIARRFPRSLRNLLQLFSPLVDQTFCFMNNDRMPELVFQQNAERRLVFHHDFFSTFATRGSAMSIQTPPVLSQETQAMLDCLRQTVAKTLDRKRRLGQYAVLWSEGAPIAVGEDAPAQLAARKVSQD